MSLTLPRTPTLAMPALRLRDWTAHEVAFGRFQLWLPVLGAVGIALAVEAPFDPSPAALATALVCLLAVRTVAGRRRALAALAPIAAALAALTAGALALTAQSEWGGTPVVRSAQSVTFTGRVSATERRGPARQRVVVAVDEGNFRGAVPRKLRISVRLGDDGTPSAVGQRIEVSARLFPLQGPVYPGSYDAARRLYFDGIGATGFAYGAPEVLKEPGRFDLGARIDAARTAIEERIHAAMSPQNAPFAAALLVGRRGLMDNADVEALRLAGLGHILAISGLHMALVAGSVFAAVRLGLALIPPLALRYPIRKWAAVVGIAAATVYLALSGGSVATVRAYVMLSVALVAILADRPAITMRTVAVAAVVLMALDPVSVVEPGFQMSFLAVVALVGAYEWWSANKLRWDAGWARPFVAFVVGLAMTSLIAGFATGPAAAYHFNRLPPLGLVGNLAAMPFVTFLAMPAGVLSLMAMPFGLEWLPLAAMDLALTAILAIAHQVAEWSGTAGFIGAIPAASALLSVLGLLWLAIFLAPWRLVGAAFLVAGLVTAPFGPRYDVIVSEDAEAVAARGLDGTLSLYGNPDGFAASIWMQADGDVRQPDGVPLARCDGLGCTLPLGHGVAAVAHSQRALTDDCLSAEVVVSAENVRACPAGLVIDRARLSRHGSHAALRTRSGWAVTTVRPHGLVRHWHVPPTIERP